MKRAIGAAMGAVFLMLTGVSTAARAAEPESRGECVGAAAWKDLVVKHSSGVSILVLSDIDGVEAKAVVERINDTPPKTSMAADHVIVLGARSLADDAPAPYVLVAFFNHDCLVSSGRADPAEAASLLSGQSI